MEQPTFAQEMLRVKGEEIKNKIVAISGSGNVAQYATQKINDLGGRLLPYPIQMVIFTIQMVSLVRS